MTSTTTEMLTSHDVAALLKVSRATIYRMSGDAWFLLADPAQVPSLQYGYLASAQGVQIQRREMWDTLGLSFRAFLDFGAGWADWRGAFKAARD